MTHSNGTKPNIVWPWSPGAVRAFVEAASRGGMRFNVPAGLDAALLHDLTDLNGALARYRIDLLTGPALKPRKIHVTIPEGQWEFVGQLTEANFGDGPVRVTIPITRKLLCDLLAIPKEG